MLVAAAAEVLEFAIRLYTRLRDPGGVGLRLDGRISPLHEENWTIDNGKQMIYVHIKYGPLWKDES